MSDATPNHHQKSSPSIPSFKHSIRHSSFIRRLLSDEGTVAVSFILCLPIFLTLVAIFVQYALLVNAKNELIHATEVAARSAAVCLPSDPGLDNFDGSQKINQAARMALVALSPRAKSGASSEGQSVADALQTVGIPISDADYAARYTYAADATAVTWPQANYVQSHAQQIALTIHYQFHLTVPVANYLIGYTGNIDGVGGRYVDIGASVSVETAHGREAGGP